MIMYVECGYPDCESYLIVTPENGVEDIVKTVQAEWDGIDLEDLIILPFYKSQYKRIKQTLELV